MPFAVSFRPLTIFARIACVRVSGKDGLTGFGYRGSGFGYRGSGILLRVTGVGFRGLGAQPRPEERRLDRFRVSGIEQTKEFRVSGFGVDLGGWGGVPLAENDGLAGFGYRVSGILLRGSGFGDANNSAKRGVPNRFPRNVGLIGGEGRDFQSVCRGLMVNRLTINLMINRLTINLMVNRLTIHLMVNRLTIKVKRLTINGHQRAFRLTINGRSGCDLHGEVAALGEREELALLERRVVFLAHLRVQLPRVRREIPL
ncbi:hypothetical protein T484DRAFT_1757611 [Baffinella frigidus]|nr:hypothetical protein T484DRAFT_1757611 [Cryptophyta sp. CCMP2293]